MEGCWDGGIKATHRTRKKLQTSYRVVQSSTAELLEITNCLLPSKASTDGLCLFASNLTGPRIRDLFPPSPKGVS